MADYHGTFLLQAADELERLPEDSALGVMILDYADLRARIRAMADSE